MKHYEIVYFSVCPSFCLSICLFVCLYEYLHISTDFKSKHMRTSHDQRILKKIIEFVCSRIRPKGEENAAEGGGFASVSNFSV